MGTKEGGTAANTGTGTPAAADGDKTMDEGVAELVSMGFSPDEAANTLSANGGNLMAALEALTGMEELGDTSLKKHAKTDKDTDANYNMDERVAVLVSMGFPADNATAALSKHGGDLDATVMALTNAEGGGASGSSGAGMQNSSGAVGNIANADVAEIVSMGFSADQAVDALAANGGNLVAAVEALTGQDQTVGSAANIGLGDIEVEARFEDEQLRRAEE